VVWSSTGILRSLGVLTTTGRRINQSNAIRVPAFDPLSAVAKASDNNVGERSVKEGSARRFRNTSGTRV